MKKGEKTYSEKGFATDYDKVTKKTSKNMKVVAETEALPKAIIKLSKQKKGTYYVRFRCSNISGHYTKWSKAKKIKVK